MQFATLNVKIGSTQVKLNTGGAELPSAEIRAVSPGTLRLDQDNACGRKESIMKAQTKPNTTYKIVVTAIMIALATILNEVTSFESPFLMGGGVTVFSQVSGRRVWRE